MVGHTGNFGAAVKAVETLDACIGRVVTALRAAGGELLITADHGNAEKMLDETPASRIPPIRCASCRAFMWADPRKWRPAGRSRTFAPTLLAMLGLPQPAEMTGHSLLTFV
jgi:2,3-bisphosphoglycerate-independent phosphoglycerate mutase